MGRSVGSGWVNPTQDLRPRCEAAKIALLGGRHRTLRGVRLADVLRLFDDRAFRSRAIARVANFQVRRFWLNEYERYRPWFRIDAIQPIQNKA